MDKYLIIRKVHKYFGLIIGVQLLMWTISGLYFSWTDLNKIHGDHFKNLDYETNFYTDLIGLDQLKIEKGIQSIELREIGNTPFYWINNKYLINAINGHLKDSISQSEAVEILKKRVKSNLEIKSINYISETNNHSEYRNKTLPAYVISFKNTPNLKAYISCLDGKFQTVRYKNWRIFDFFWMAHTMDYKTRDNFNNLVLRIFAVLGVITIVSGFGSWISLGIYKKLQKNK